TGGGGGKSSSGPGTGGGSPGRLSRLYGGTSGCRADTAGRADNSPTRSAASPSQRRVVNMVVSSSLPGAQTLLYPRSPTLGMIFLAKVAPPEEPQRAAGETFRSRNAKRPAAEDGGAGQAGPAGNSFALIVRRDITQARRNVTGERAGR